MAELSSLKDEEIMQKIAEYDSKALEQLYNRYAPTLYTFIRKIVSDKKVSEEVLSDVFVIIWKNIDQIDFKITNVYTWLVMLTRNKAIDVLNRQSGKKMEDYTSEYEREKIIPRLSHEIKPIELDEVKAKKEKIESAMNSLTDAQRYVLELSYYGGMQEDEIAAKLKIPAVTVKSKLQVAIGNLMQKLSEVK